MNSSASYAPYNSYLLRRLSISLSFFTPSCVYIYIYTFTHITHTLTHTHTLTTHFKHPNGAPRDDHLKSISHKFFFLLYTARTSSICLRVALCGYPNINIYIPRDDFEESTRRTPGYTYIFVWVDLNIQYLLLYIACAVHYCALR